MKSKSIQIWGSLLLVCVLSRLASAIFYIEDIDSLRFAQSAVEYDVLNNKPHFPGYPLFCALLQLVYRAIGSTAYSFSLIGGIATFLIVVSTLRIQRLMMPKGPAVYLLGIILFFNPLMWLMGNRYMPDLLGLGMLQVALWLLLEYRIGERKKQEQSVLVFLGLSIGFLAGIRLSFLPFFLPAFFSAAEGAPLVFDLWGACGRSTLVSSMGECCWLACAVGVGHTRCARPFHRMGGDGDIRKRRYDLEVYSHGARAFCRRVWGVVDGSKSHHHGHVCFDTGSGYWGIYPFSQGRMAPGHCRADGLLSGLLRLGLFLSEHCLQTPSHFAVDSRHGFVSGFGGGRIETEGGANWRCFDAVRFFGALCPHLHGVGHPASVPVSISAG